MMTDGKSRAFQEGLNSVTDTAETLVAALRAMAAGEGEYSRFQYVSPWIRNIWRAAADWIEQTNRGHVH